MSERDRNDVNRDSNQEEVPGRQKIQREDTSARESTGTTGDSGTNEDPNKSGIDKLIDKAQEKGVFGKAEKFVRDKFGGGSGGRKGR